MNVQASAIQPPFAMRLSDIITRERILVDREGALPSKAEALRALARLLGREAASAWLAPAPESPAHSAEDQRLFAAALVILLESGTPLEQPIEITTADKLTLSDLVQRALDADPSGAAHRCTSG